MIIFTFIEALQLFWWTVNRSGRNVLPHFEQGINCAWNTICLRHYHTLYFHLCFTIYGLTFRSTREFSKRESSPWNLELNESQCGSVFRPNIPLLLNNIGCVINVGQHLEHDRAGILQCVTYSLCETRDIIHGFHWMHWYLCFYICMKNVQGWALMSLYYYVYHDRFTH